MGTLVLVVADVVFTIINQKPLNLYIQNLDFNHLSPEQSSQLQGLRDKDVANFSFRHYLQWGQFILMSFTPYLLAKLEEKFSTF